MRRNRFANQFLFILIFLSFCDTVLGWNIGVKVLVEDCNAYKNYRFQCSSTFSAISTTQATAGSAVMMISGATVLLALFAYFVVHKRRQQASIEPGFEMMKDPPICA